MYSYASKGSASSTKSLDMFSSGILKTYAGIKTLIRGIKVLYRSVEDTSDYIEAFNYYTVAFGKIASKWDKNWENYGSENAQKYGNSFVKEMNNVFSKLSGVSYSPDDGLITETGMKNLGLSIQEVTQYAAQLASMMDSVGQSGEVALAATSAFTKLAGDISSLYNVDYSSAANNVRSVLMGQSRAGYKYGWDTTNAGLQVMLDSLNIDKSISDMSQMEKQQLRILKILQDSRVAWGDQANTINNLANQMRLLKNSFKEAGLMLGQLFVPLFTKLVPVLNGATIAAQKFFTSIASMFGIKINAEEMSSGYKETEDAFDDMSESLDDVAESAKKAKSSLRGFDELKTISSGSDSSSLKNTLDLTEEIINATKEYESVWQEAYEKMENKAQEYSDKITEFFQESGITPFFQSLFSVAVELIPVLENLWNVFFKPLVEFTGEVAIFALNSLATALTAVSNWMNNNQQLIILTTEYITAFFVAWGGYTILSKAKDAIETLYIYMLYAKDGINGLINPTNLWLAGIASLAVGIIELTKNWNKMTSLERVITIFSGLAAAAAAAVAIGIFHTTWSVGIAAATIAAGIALIVATQASIKDATNSQTYQSIPKYEVGGFPESASLFWANENGVPELVGTMGGKTAVASGMEITGIKDAIYSTGQQESNLMQTMVGLLRIIADKEYGITDDQIGKSAQRYARDYFNRTGDEAYRF